MSNIEEQIEEVVDAAQSNDEGADSNTEGPSPAYSPEGFGFYDADGKELSEFDPKVAEFLSGSQIRYKALGEEHTKPLQELVRTASRGHLNEKQYEHLSTENKTLAEQLQELERTNKDFSTQSKTWDSVLEAAARGDIEPFLNVMKRYMQPDTGQQTDTSAAQELEALKAQQAGEAIVRDEIRPYLAKVAENYNIPEEQRPALEKHVLDTINQIPDNLLTPERVAHYLKVELLGELESEGHSFASGTAKAEPGANASKEIMDELLELRAKVANQENTQAADKAKSGPPSSGQGGGGAGSGGESIVPKDLTPKQLREWLAAG